MYLAAKDDDIATSTTVASTDGNAVTTGVQLIVTLLNDDIATSSQSIGTYDCRLLTIEVWYQQDRPSNRPSNGCRPAKQCCSNSQPI